MYTFVKKKKVKTYRVAKEGESTSVGCPPT